MAETEGPNAVVIGAGSNGLVAANYLADAGLRVVAVEARPVVGGACVTEELLPGSRWSSCAFIAGLFNPRLLKELELQRWGLELYQSDVLGMTLRADGARIIFHKEIDRTLREIERHSKADARAFLDFGVRLRRFAQMVEPWQLQAPPRRSELIRAFEEAGEERLFDEFVVLSAKDLMDRYFETDILKGYLIFFAMVAIHGGPSSPGTSYVYAHHSSGDFNGEFGEYGFVRGGMGGIAQALAERAKSRGVVIRTGAPVAEVLVRGGRAVGVVLESGEEIAADVVVSNADPKRSLLKLVDEKHLDRQFRTEVEKIDMRGSMARIHLLIDELPAYVGFGPGEGLQHHGHTVLGGSVETFERGWEAQRRGEFLEDCVIEAVIQSTHDRSLAPEGQHTLTLGVQQLPYELKGTTWSAVKESWADRVVAEYCRYAPNIKDHIVGRVVITPEDLEREYLLTGGNIFQGHMVFNQLYGARPLPALASYRTPIMGYYLCGAGMHPGGGVMGAPGHNAAKVVISDITGATAAEPSKGGDGQAGARRDTVTRLMGTDWGARLGYEVAKRPAFRGITRRLARQRKSGHEETK
jgi:phytoene dehydrogenase-like protein